MFSSGFGPSGDHMFPFYLIIRRQQPYCSTPFYLLFNLCSLPSLLLNPSYASKISTHVLMWIYLQAYLKVLGNSITNLLDCCWSPSYSKLCFNMVSKNFDSCSICYSPQLWYSFSSFIFHFFSFSFFDFLYSYLAHGFIP
jgi:hypothetical protein